MSFANSIIETAPFFLTFSTAVISSFYDFDKKWQNILLGCLGVVGLMLGFFFFFPLSQIDVAPMGALDFSFDKFSLFIGSIFCISLFVGIFPIREQINVTRYFPYYLAFGLGIIFSSNLFTFFLFWFLQRFMTVMKFARSIRRGEGTAGGTFIIQHLLTLVAFLILVSMAYQENYLFSSFNEIPVVFFSWPVFILSFIVIYESHGIFPLHSWVHDLVGNIAWYEITCIILSRAGVLLFVKFLMPTLDQYPGSFQIILLTFSIISSIYWTMMGIFETHVMKTATYFYIAQSSLIFSGLLADLVASRGAYLHLIVISLSGTAIWSILQYIHRHTPIKRFNQFYGLAQFYPRTATIFCLFGLCMIGVPLGASFVVEDLVITGLVGTHPYLGLGHILATCLNGILFLLVFSKLFLGQTPFKKSQPDIEMGIMQMAPFVMILLFMFLMGIFPSYFLKLITW